MEVSLKLGNILGNKISLNKFRKFEMISCILYDHNAIKLKIDNQQINSRYTSSWRVNNTLMNDERVKEEINKGIKNFRN